MIIIIIIILVVLAVAVVVAVALVVAVVLVVAMAVAAVVVDMSLCLLAAKSEKLAPTIFVVIGAATISQEQFDAPKSQNAVQTRRPVRSRAHLEPLQI